MNPNLHQFRILATLRDSDQSGLSKLLTGEMSIQTHEN